MIRKEMTLEEIARHYPQTIEVFKRFGLDCFDCQLASLGSLEHCAEFHDLDADQLVRELNAALEQG
jgi:hybrid cluster-associated redox disulfide protein